MSYISYFIAPVLINNVTFFVVTILKYIYKGIEGGLLLLLLFSNKLIKRRYILYASDTLKKL